MNPSFPLVSIVCTCYNQRDFVTEALRSVLDQTYPTIELIVINDCSSDESATTISDFLKPYPEVLFINNKTRLGLCKNFNQGFHISKGDYLVDLSGDDILSSTKIERQVNYFENLPKEYGVIYSNAELIDMSGKVLGLAYPVDSSNRANIHPPEGDVYLDLIKQHAIATQTMLMRRATLEELGGYDERLAYEDFDFWIRSSRNWKYAYQNEILMKIRKLPGSLSTKQYNRNDEQLRSTYEVCRKIKSLNKTSQENRALIERLKYEIKHAVLAEKRDEAKLFIELLNELQPLSMKDRLFEELNRSGIKTNWLRTALLAIKNRY